MVMEPGLDEPGDQFPAGLRVLAVDDEPTCLKVLEVLLTRCKYRVRTTSRALEALEILRENKFDLVISDVHMPDMDGLKLLEHVGLEMDLPVIMLSANADPKVVMKGIDNGACDYLLKPIRVEELKNIWQHVVRKKKHDSRNQNNSGNQENQHEAGEGQYSGNVDPNGNMNKKRKDQNDEEVEAVDDNNVEDEDSSAPKRSRIVWSMDLHRKFVYAVNQLGLDKAVPKKILDLMNVEKLTRENVASHLQKYRIYLRRMNSAQNRQPNSGPASGSADPNYLRQLLTLAASGTFPPSGMLGQLNNAQAGFGTHGLPSQGSGNMGHARNSSTFPGNHNANILHQGVPTPFELEELQNINDVTIGGLSNTMDDLTIFPSSSGLPDATVTHGNQSSLAMASSNSDHVSGNSNWSNVVHTSVVQPNPFALGDSFQQASLHLQGQEAPNNVNAGQHIGNVPAQGFNFYRQDGSYRPNFIGSSTSSVTPGNAALSSLTNFGGNMNVNFVNHGELDQSRVETSMQRQEAYLAGQQNPQGSFVSPNFGSLEDLASAMLRQHQENGKPDGYFGPGSSYPPRTSQ